MLCLVSWAICLKKKNVSIFLDWVAFRELCKAWRQLWHKLGDEKNPQNSPLKLQFVFLFYGTDVRRNIVKYIFKKHVILKLEEFKFSAITLVDWPWTLPLLMRMWSEKKEERRRWEKRELWPFTPFPRTYTFLHPHSYAEAHTLLLFVCRLLSAVIGVTFIFAPEACLPVSITWSQTWRDGDLTECHMIGMNAEPNVPERAILYRSPAARRMTGSPAVSVLVTTARYTTRAQTANWAQRCI